MADLRLITDLSYGDHPRHRADLVCPEDGGERPVVVCVHGGWWHSGRRGNLLPLAIALAERGFAAATIDYRLLGDGVSDGRDIVADVVAALPTVIEEASLYGAKAGSAWLLGSGAGALTALVAAMRCDADADAPSVYGVAACGAPGGLTPWDNCPDTVATQLQAYAGHHAAELDPLQASADALPPLFMVHGDHDQDVPVAAARELVRHALTVDGEAHCAVLSGVGHHVVEDASSRGAISALDRLVPWFSGDS